MTTISPQKIPFKYFCEKCNYGCRNKKDYNRHLSTRKHKNTTNTTNFSPKIPTAYSCEFCGKSYSHRASLYNHKRTCFSYLHNVDNNVEGCNNINAPESSGKENEFKDLVIMLLKENKEIQKNFMELIPHIKGNITSNSHNTTTTNNQFNINMFLNEQCKNAMNLTDFINSLPITNETYDHTIENGLTKTITSLVVEGLNDLDLYQRPIHCTDPVRKTMYVKDNDVWEKDSELKLLLQGIKTLSFKQRTNLCTWQDANNGWDKDENLQTRMTKLVYNSMDNIEDNVKETNKIIRAIGRNTYLSNDIKTQLNI